MLRGAGGNPGLRSVGADVRRQGGLTPLELGTMMHCPRLPAVAVARLLETRGERAKAGLFRGLQAWERLAGGPTRFLTGYVLTLRARKAEAR